MLKPFNMHFLLSLKKLKEDIISFGTFVVHLRMSHSLVFVLSVCVGGLSILCDFCLYFIFCSDIFLIFGPQNKAVLYYSRWTVA